ncbi:MAG: rifamycin-inactivating phosphotransferase [Microthrixaceae bacterium]
MTSEGPVSPGPSQSARLVVPLTSVDRDQVGLVGAKAANLGEVRGLGGIGVPEGYCVTTAAFDLACRSDPAIELAIASLTRSSPDDAHAVRAASGELRGLFQHADIPRAVKDAVAEAVSSLGDDTPLAVRSSATTEDLPGHSFAGQYDSVLDVVGLDAVLDALRRCWGSLFNDHAVQYRLRNRLHHHAASMGVLLQRLVPADASGVLFTADPVTSNRLVSVVESTRGLGDALVSGTVTPDYHRVLDGRITERTPGAKERDVTPLGGDGAVGTDGGGHSRPTSGTKEFVLTDRQVLSLADLGQVIADHMGSPQDIEWSLVGGHFEILQSRPITTLFPVPENPLGDNRVYISVGHQQMMTDAMRPLAISMWQMVTPAPAREAASRLFVDATDLLASEAARAGALETFGRADPLLRDALETVLEIPGFITVSDGSEPARPLPEPSLLAADQGIVDELVADWETSLEVLRSSIVGYEGTELIEFIRSDIGELRRLLFEPSSMAVIMSAQGAAEWLNDNLGDWLGETNAADVLVRSVPGDVSAEMGLALMDVADVIRRFPGVVSHLTSDRSPGFLDRLGRIEGGTESIEAIGSFLDRYGRHCVGEIDITRPRWIEEPELLAPLLAANVANLDEGAAARLRSSGESGAAGKGQEVLTALRELPGGDERAGETAEVIARLRTFSGFREYPKFAMMNRYYEYRCALLGEADRLVHSGVIDEASYIYWLTFDELSEVVASGVSDRHLIEERRRSFAAHEALRPPRVLTSAGECLDGAYHRDDVPQGALVGLGVSAGTVTGRVRVIHRLEDAEPDPGDILVTTHTDPSWSPLFASVSGLVTEVGGTMTHGAVVAREYGLPAVVGVLDATRLLPDGALVRLDATAGIVEVLD